VSRGDRIALGILAALAIGRTLAFLVFANLHFDSDQAVMGIMAIDLSHLDALPIVMYGQTYMLGVIAWLAAPLFAIFGSSIALLKAPFVPINVLAAATLFVIVRRTAGLGTVTSALVSATLAVPTVIVSAAFMNASGGHVEPILYVLLLFLLRRRPVLLGVAGAFMVAHRETTALALIALAIVEISRAQRRREALIRWAGTAGVCALALVVLRFLAQWSTNYGGMSAGFALTEDVVHSLSWLATDTSIALGLAPHDVHDTGLALPYVEGSVGSLIALGTLAMLAIWNGLRQWRSWKTGNQLAVGVYVTLTCVFVAGAFAARQMSHDTLLVRYLLTLVLLPGALATMALSGHPRPMVRTAACAALVWLVASNVVANAGYYRGLATANLRDPLGDVAAYLDSNRVTNGLAPYWVAYNLTFRTGGRVHMASSDVVRIPAYQDEYDAASDRAVRIDDGPCEPAKLVKISGIAICLQ